MGQKKSTEEFTEDGKTMTHDGIREWEKRKLEMLRREWWLQGYTLSMEMMTEVRLKGCKWA